MDLADSLNKIAYSFTCTADTVIEDHYKDRIEIESYKDRGLLALDNLSKLFGFKINYGKIKKPIVFSKTIDEMLDIAAYCATNTEEDINLILEDARQYVECAQAIKEIAERGRTLPPSLA